MMGDMAAGIETAEIAEFLGQIWAFERLAPEQLGVLARLVNVRKLAEDKVLWLQGQKVTFFSIVFSGRLRSVRRTSGGSEKLVSTLVKGHHFGLAEMITGANSAVTLLADKESRVLVMNGKSLRTQLLSHADICYRLMQTMARAIFGLTRELERASFENVHARLARLLVRKRGRGVPVGRGGAGEQEVSHQELAVQIGTSRETVSRALADFKREGLVETSYRRITVLDRPGLQGYIEDHDQW